MRDHSKLHKRSWKRDLEALVPLKRWFGALILHEITAHRIEQFLRERLAGKWRGHQTTGPAKPIKPATVNRELATLSSMLSKAVEWGKLIASPAKAVRKLKPDNRRTRILTEEEQNALLEAAPRKPRSISVLLLVTSARIGELLTLRWEHCQDGYVTFWKTKNGKARRIRSVRRSRPCWPASRGFTRGFTNSRTGKPYTTNGVAHVFKRAVKRAGITSHDVTLHTLRHTALSRKIAGGHDDYTVMEIAGHSDTRILARDTHPTEQRRSRP